LTEKPENTAVDAKTLSQAKHAGWLAGTAVRLGCNSSAYNPYAKGSEAHIYWEMGFETGLNG
jgi:hypothetical protein